MKLLLFLKCLELVQVCLLQMHRCSRLALLDEGLDALHTKLAETDSNGAQFRACQALPDTEFIHAYVYLNSKPEFTSSLFPSDLSLELLTAFAQYAIVKRFRRKIRETLENHPFVKLGGLLAVILLHLQ